MQFDTYGYKYTQGHLSAARVSACPASLLFFCSLSCMAAALNISAACVSVCVCVRARVCVRVSVIYTEVYLSVSIVHVMLGSQSVGERYN